MSNPFLTIITPTYNRADRLLILYKSLINQTDKNFQWLVVDDGSNDNTQEVLASFHGHLFDYDFFIKENGGKHTALNYSHPYIKGQLVCIVDSDDWLLPDAVKKIRDIHNQYASKEDVACYMFQKGEGVGDPLNKGFRSGIIISNDIDYRVNSKYNGDCCEVVSTKVFKSHPFPEHEGEKFLAEGYLWQHVGFHYNTVYINDVIYICEYLEEGLTKSGRRLRIQCPLGGMDNSNSYFEKVPGRRVKMGVLFKEAMLFDCYGKFAKLSFVEIVKKCHNHFLAVWAYPFGFLLYKYWEYKYLND